MAKKFSTNNIANCLKYMTKVNREIIAFDLVHDTQINMLIEGLTNKKSSWLDNISNILVKRLCYTIRIPLTIIYNKSVMTGTFPDMCKIAKEITVHRREESFNDNYRPIFLLQVLLKF